jgi:hypothetical protein
MSDEIFGTQDELLFATSKDQYNNSDIILSRMGGHFRGTLVTSVTPVGSQSWVNDALTNTPYSFTGVVHEVIVFDKKLSDSERDQVYGYLSRKYGMDNKLPDALASAHPSAAIVGQTYWAISNHPNSVNFSNIPAGSEFSGITISNFLSMADTIYKSAGTRLPDGTVISGDTYGTLGA